MLYWCGFDILWKMDLALLVGFAIHKLYKKSTKGTGYISLCWFVGYMGGMLLVSCLGSFGGWGYLHFPLDALVILPLSISVLQGSQSVLLDKCSEEDLEAQLGAMKSKIEPEASTLSVQPIPSTGF